MDGDVMLPNVCSKPMAEVLGPPVFLVKGRLRRRETKNQSAGFLPNPERHIENVPARNSLGTRAIFSLLYLRVSGETPSVISWKLPGRST